MKKIILLLFGLLLYCNSYSQLLTENFDDVTTLSSAGWDFINVSTTIGFTEWFQGANSVFKSQVGGPKDYIATDYNNTTGTNTISNWMILPVLSVKNGDEIKFYTRTVTGNPYPDRLEVRLSDSGAGSTAPTNDTDVGSYTNLLLTINSLLNVSGYPEAWILQTIVISGLTGTTDVRIALRYFVTDGGPTGINSFYIGIDELEVSATLGVEDFSLLSLKYFYNKDTKILSLDSQNTLNSIAIYNILGQEVLTKNLTSNYAEISLSYLQTGVYLVKITGNNNAFKTIKLGIN